MIGTRFLEFLLVLLPLHCVHSEEAEPRFKAEGSVIEMGYCFGVDYIVVYRVVPEGDQLLGNSSASSPAITPPADLEGRISISEQQSLLGLQISSLTHMDSGIYRRECWQGRTLVSQHTHQLYVCNEEVESEEIIVEEGDGGSELLCNSTSIGLEGTSVRWYREMYPLYKLTLLLDSSVSLDPLVEELEAAIQVRDSGALLLLNNSMLNNNQHFYCLVIKGQNCLSFQNMYLPDHSETREIFASQGDRVVLSCPSDGKEQQWETPLGRINSSSIVKHNQMYISLGAKSEDFSLVIPAVSDDQTGDYSCISSSLEYLYTVVLCPKKKSQQRSVFEGGDVMLDCDVGKESFQGLQWHRREPSGKPELIHDSNDETVPIPEDLRGRVTLSENSSKLTISYLKVKDPGVYWCVVLGGPEFLEEDGDYEEDLNAEDPGEYEYKDDEDWQDTTRCIFKQENILALAKPTGTSDSDPMNRKPVTSPPAEESGSNVTGYAVGAVLGGLLLVGVIVAVAVILRKRASASQKHSGAAYHSGPNTPKDIKMNVDTGCTERLTSGVEHSA